MPTVNNLQVDGKIVRDVQEDIASIEWTVYGKMKKITRNSGSSKADLEFGYDASGNRLWKKVIPKGSGAVISTYYYLRDAQGNEMCRYVKYTNTTSQLMYVAQEHSIYGSTRVGVDNRKDTLYMSAAYTPTWGGVGTSRRDLGLKSFELANHLGNVLVTVSDKPIYKVSSATIYFNPELTSSSDYYPFGAPIKGRSATFGDENRFGFNGKEKDPEGMGGAGSTYDYGFRIYNPQIAKFLSVDPLYASYAWLTPYQFAGNDPIRNIDIDGLEGGSAIEYMFTGAGQEIEGACNYYSNEVSNWWNSWSLLQSTAPNKPAPPIYNNSQQPVLKKSDALTVANQAQNNSNTAAKKDIDLREVVPFVSQYSLPNPRVACCRASQKILKDFGITAAGAKSNRIITGKNNADNTAIEPTKDAKAGVDYIHQQLESGNPVMVGVDHNLKIGQDDRQAADHFVVITGRNYDEIKMKYYFIFYEVGTINENNGKSDDNRLYVNDNNTITGTNYTQKRNFTVTDVRKN